MNKKKDTYFPLDQEVELVAIKGEKVVKKIMIYKEALNIQKKKGWRYVIYQVGFCSMKNTI